MSPAPLISPTTPAVGTSSPQTSPTAISTSGLTAPQEGLEAYYAFEGNAGSSGLKHDGYLAKGMLFDAGIKGKSVYYLTSPIEDVGIYVDDPKAVRLGKKFSISVWSKVNPSWSKDTSLPLVCTTGLDIARFGLFWSPGGADIFMNKSGTDELWLHREKEPRMDAQGFDWHHTVVSYDGELLKVYLDGKTELTKAYSNSLQDHGLLGEIGKCAAVINDHDPHRVYSMKGYIDELRIYSRVLTDAEVQALYQFDKGGSS